MSEKIIIPRVGETTGAVTILEWYKQAGDPVRKGEPLLEVETDKATLTIESFAEGILDQILKGVGEQAKGMEVVGVIRSKGEKIEESVLPLSEKDVYGDGNKSTETQLYEIKGDPASQKSKEPARKPVSPLAKRIAKENDVNLDLITGTGKDGMVTADDIRGFIKPSADLDEDVEKAELTKMRLAIGDQMARSKREIPHFYLSIQVNMEKVVELRKSLLPMYQRKHNVHLTYTHILIRALALSLQEVPKINATYKDGVLNLHKHVNIGIAVSLEEGLIVPNVSSVEKKSLIEIAIEVEDLVKRARMQRLKADEITNGTFTISNLGKSEIDLFAAIINVPEVAILATGDILPKPIADTNRVVVCPMMGAVVSADHRILDGAEVAKFLKIFKYYLEDPYVLL